MDELHHKIQVNPRADAYQGFFEEEWSQHFLDLVRESKIYEAGFNLTKNWWAISNARELPWIFSTSVDTLMCNNIENYEPYVCKIVNLLSNKIFAELKSNNVKIRPMLCKEIQKAIKTVADEICHSRDQVSEDVISRRTNLWDDLINLSPFHTSLWSLERLCYAGLYYNYEWFLTECVRIKLNDPKFRFSNKKSFTIKFSSMFGEAIANKCLDNKVDIARLTRNALVHNGGKLTEELQNMNYTFVILDNVIQITAEHTTELYKELKSRVTELSESIVKMPEFKIN